MYVAIHVIFLKVQYYPHTERAEPGGFDVIHNVATVPAHMNIEAIAAAVGRIAPQEVALGAGILQNRTVGTLVTRRMVVVDAVIGYGATDKAPAQWGPGR